MTETEQIEEPKIIDKWDHRQVKNGLDEAVKKAVSELFPEATEDFYLIDTRNWLCLVCCILCLAACGYDYLSGVFEKMV